MATVGPRGEHKIRRLAAVALHSPFEQGQLDLPPIFSPGIMRLSPCLNRSHSLSQRKLEVLGRESPVLLD